MTKRAQLADGRILEFPDNTPDAVIQKVVKQQIKQAPVSARQATQTAVQQQMRKKREAELGFFDRLFGNKPTAPKALTEVEQSTQVKDITAEKQRLLALAANLEAQAKPTKVSFDPRAPERAQALWERAQNVRAQAAALGNQAAFIEKTGVEAPKPSKVRAALTGAPREFTRGLVSLPGVLTELAGRGLSTFGASETGKYFTKSGQADQEAARKLSEDIFGAPEGALQYDSTAQLISDVSGGLGSMATFAVPGGASRLTGAGKGLVGAERAAAITKAARPGQYGIATLQGAGQGSEDIRAYEERTGKKVSDTAAFATMLLNAGLGAAEVGVFNKLVERIPVAQRGAAIEKVAEIVRRASKGKVDPTAVAKAVGKELTEIEATAAGRLAVRGGAEAAQEGGVQAGSNLIAQQLYDEERDLTEGVGQSALVGGIIGGTVRGGIELKGVLGKRAAENRKKYFEQTLAANAPLEEFDINVGSYEDPSQLTRQKVQRISEPNENGDVLARRADGTIYQTSLKELYRMRAPTEGIRAVPIPDTLSAPALMQRLTGALGNAEPDSDMQSYINSVTTTLNNNMALGTPEKTDTYLQKQQNGLRRAQLSEEAKIARMLVLDEAVKLNNEYVGLVTAPPEGTAPSVDQAVINQPPAPPSDETIQSQIDTMREMTAKRAEALNAIASDPNYIDKVETFEALMVQNGFDAPTTVEVASLYDAMRAESDAETAAGEEEGASKRQRIVDRANIIERVLYDDRISSEEKADRINAKMKAKGLGPLSRYELERIAGVQAANDVFGPEGEYTQRRQALFDQVVADPTITDKYRGYAEALDQFPELGDPTVDEIRMLRGDAAPLETQIAESAEPITTAQLPAEPGGLTEEGITTGQLEGETLRDKPKRDADARAAINELIAIEQAKLADQPHKGTPAARKAINAIKALEAERAALRESAALGEAPVADEVVQETVQEEAPTAEAAPVTEPEIFEDNPGGDWEARKQRVAEQEQAEAIANGELTGSEARMTRGSTTQTIRRVEIPVEKLRTLEGLNGEQPAPGEPKYDALRKSVGENGFDRKKVGLPIIYVNHKGEAFIAEGNNRVAVAAEEGVTSLPVEIQYRNGAEKVPSAFAPDQVLAEHKAITAPVAEEVAQEEAPAGTPVELVPYENMAVSAMWYDGGSQTAVAGAEKPAWVPSDVIQYDIPGRPRPTGNQSDVRVEQFTAKDGTVGTQISVLVPTIDEVYGDRGNVAAATIWLRGAQFVDPSTAIETAETLARWVADVNNSKKSDGPLNKFADDVLQFMSKADAVKVASPEPTSAPTPTAAPTAPATEQPAPTATKQTINNPEEDISPVEEQLEADPTTIEGAFPASLNRPRAEAIGFAADLDRRVKSMWNRVRRRFEGKYKTAYDYSRALSAAYGVTKLPADLDVARKFELLETRKIGGQMRLNRWYLQPIEDKVVELGLDPADIAMYLWARSAPARNALVRERNGEQNGSGMSDAQAQAKLDELELEGLGPKLREVAKLHDALVDYMGNQRVKAGLLPKKVWEAMRKAQPFYTPLKGYALDGDMQVDGEPNPHSDEERGIAKKNGTRVREALTTRGRKSIPFNPLFNLMTDAQSAIARIEQNKVKQTFLNNILSDPKSHEDLVTVYTPKKKTHASGLVTMPKIGPNGPVNMNQVAAQPDANLMIVKKDGEPYYIEFAETPAGNALYRLFGNMSPRLLDQIMHAGYSFRAGDMQMRIPSIAEVGSFLKSMKTRYSPVFTFGVSWLRDFSEALATARAAQGIKGGPAEGTKLFRRTLRNIAAVRSGMGTISNYLKGKDPTTAEGELMALLFDQFLEDGGAVGHAQIMDAERYAQDTAKTIRRYAAAKRADPIAAALLAKDAVAGALDHASQLFDLHARFATYRAALEENISREDAAALALDSTLDMTRRGEMASLLDNWSFFFSPTVGGARKLLSQGRYSTIARKLFTKLVGAGMLLYLFNRFGPGAGDEDEDERPNILEVNNVTAQTRVIVRYGPGINDYASIPTAFGIGYFNYVGGQLMAMFLQDIEPMEAATNIVTGFVSLASPIKAEGTEGLSAGIDLLVPDVGLQPVRDLMANRNAFGSQIYTPQGEYSTEPKSELGREETGKVWKFIARGMNSLFGGTDTVESAGSAQPEQYRYIAQQVLGGAYGFGRDTLNLLTGEAKPDKTLAERIPIVSTYFGKGGEYVPMDKFYKDYDMLRSIHSTYKKSDENPEAWAENEAAFPVQADTRVMDAFDTALSEIQSINKKYRAGEYASVEDKYDALNDVYKAFNQTYNEVKKQNK